MPSYSEPHHLVVLQMGDFGHGFQTIFERREEVAHSIGVGAAIALTSGHQDIDQVDGNHGAVPVEKGAIAGTFDASEDGGDERNALQSRRQRVHVVFLHVLRVADDRQAQVDDGFAVLCSCQNFIRLLLLLFFLFFCF